MSKSERIGLGNWLIHRRPGRRILCLLGMIGVVAGCRLYEPARYARTTTAADPGAIRVLMIGNSLTYYNDLPGLLQQFSSREARSIYVEGMTVAFSSLRDHWSFGRAPRRIDEGHWDYVVLQDFSRKPVTDPEDCLKYYELFSERARRAGAKVIVFENWTRRGKDGEYAALAATYGRIVERTGGIAAPIGAAFQAARAARPDIPMLLDDRHPTDAGSYLAACVLYDVIYRKESKLLPWDIPGPKVPREAMGALRGIADQTVESGAGR